MPDTRDEIDLSDYINIIIKRKYVLISTFLLSVAVTTLVMFFSPKKYEISMSIKPPVVDVNDYGNPVYLYPPQKIVSEINNELTARESDFKIDILKDSEIIRISALRTKDMARDAVRVMNGILSVLTEKYKPVVDYRKKVLQKRMAANSDKIKFLSEDLVVKKANAEVTEKRMEILFKEADDTASEPFPCASSNQLFFLMLKNENIQNRIANWEEKIDGLESEQANLDFKTKNVRNLTALEKPAVLENPVSMPRKKNIAVSAIFGLITGMFLVFFLEYWQKEVRGNIGKK